MRNTASRKWFIIMLLTVVGVVWFLFATNRISLNILRSSVLGIRDTYEGILDNVIQMEMHVPEDVTVVPGETFGIPFSVRTTGNRRLYGIAGKVSFDSKLAPGNYSSVLLRDFGSHFTGNTQYILALPTEPVADNSELFSLIAEAPATEGEYAISANFQASVDFRTVDITGITVKVIVKKPGAPAPGIEPSPPTADAGPPVTAFVSEAVMLDASLSSDPQNLPLVYAWTEKGEQPLESEFNDNPNKSFTFSTAGAHEIDLHVRNSINLVSQTTKLIQVNEKDNTPPTLIVSAPAKARLNSQIAIDTSQSSDSDGSIVQFEYEVATKPSGAQPQFTAGFFRPDKAGKYILRITAVDNRGGKASKEIAINAYPYGACQLVDISGPTAFVPDGKCDIFDLDAFIGAFGKKPAQIAP